MNNLDNITNKLAVIYTNAKSAQGFAGYAAPKELLKWLGAGGAYGALGGGLLGLLRTLLLKDEDTKLKDYLRSIAFGSTIGGLAGLPAGYLAAPATAKRRYVLTDDNRVGTSTEAPSAIENLLNKTKTYQDLVKSYAEPDPTAEELNLTLPTIPDPQRNYAGSAIGGITGLGAGGALGRSVMRSGENLLKSYNTNQLIESGKNMRDAGWQHTTESIHNAIENLKLKGLPVNKNNILKAMTDQGIELLSRDLPEKSLIREATNLGFDVQKGGIRNFIRQIRGKSPATRTGEPLNYRAELESASQRLQNGGRVSGSPLRPLTESYGADVERALQTLQRGRHAPSSRIGRGARGTAIAVPAMISAYYGSRLGDWAQTTLTGKTPVAPDQSVAPVSGSNNVKHTVSELLSNLDYLRKVLEKK